MADMNCTPCKHLSREIKATVWCMSCEEALCEQCTNYHKILTVTKNHVPINIDNYQNIADFLSLLETKCKHHPEKQIQYQCHTHDRLVCILCKGDKHCDCKDIRVLDNELHAEETYARLRLLSTDLKGNISLMKTFCDKRRSNLNLLDSQQDQFLHALDKIRKDINASFDKLQTELKEKIVSMHEFEKRKLEHECNTYLKTKVKTQEQLKQLSRIINLKPLSHVQLFLTWRHFISQNTNYEAQMKEFITNVFESSLDFKMDINISDSNHSIQIDESMKVTRTFKPDIDVTHTVKTENLSSDGTKDSTNEVMATESSAMVKEKALSSNANETDLVTKHRGDHGNLERESNLEQSAWSCRETGNQKAPLESPFICSARFDVLTSTGLIQLQCIKHLPNGKLILGEIHQSRLLIYEKSGIQCGEIRLTFCPQSISAVDNTRVAVTCGKYVVLVNFQSLSVERFFFLDDECYGITYMSNYLVVNCLTQGLVILDALGNWRKCYSSLKGVLYLTPINELTVAIALRDSHFVYSMNIISNSCMKFECPYLSGASSIPIDSARNLYVSCDKTDKIYFLKCGSEKFKPILLTHNGEIHKPRCIDFNGCTLYVVVCPRSIYMYYRT